MKTIDCNVEKLFECYCMCDDNSEKKDYIQLAKDVLNSRNYMSFLNKLVIYHQCELLVLESQLGLSGVQNEDNL